LKDHQSYCNEHVEVVTNQIRPDFPNSTWVPAATMWAVI